MMWQRERERLILAIQVKTTFRHSHTESNLLSNASEGLFRKMPLKSKANKEKTFFRELSELHKSVGEVGSLAYWVIFTIIP